MFPISIFFLLIVWIAHDSYDSLDSCPLFVPSLEQDTPKITVLYCNLVDCELNYDDDNKSF